MKTPEWIVVVAFGSMCVANNFSPKPQNMLLEGTTEAQLHSPQLPSKCPLNLASTAERYEVLSGPWKWRSSEQNFK
jgi:hypothetical protein